MKSEWPRAALVQNAPALRDQVKPVGPASVGSFHLVVEPIQQRWEVDAELAHAGVRHARPLRLVARAAEEDSILHIRLHLPHIGRVRLENVDSVEIDLALVLLSQLVEGGNLPPEWWSSVAAKHQNDRPLRPQRAEVNRDGVVEVLDRERRRSIANLEMPSTRASPEGFKGYDEVSRHRHMRHDATENLRRLPHGPRDVADKAYPEEEAQGRDGDCWSTPFAPCALWLNRLRDLSHRASPSAYFVTSFISR